MHKFSLQEATFILLENETSLQTGIRMHCPITARSDACSLLLKLSNFLRRLRNFHFCGK